MHPVIIQIGPLVVRWYSIMIAIACLAGLWLARSEAERKGIAKERAEIGRKNSKGESAA